MIGINGHSGFIGSHLIKKLNDQGFNNINDIKLLPRVFNKSDLLCVDKIVFLSSPSDYEDFENRFETANSMLSNYVYNLLLINNVNPEIHIIFASSEAVEDNLKLNEQSNYAIFKMAIERFISSTMKNWTIVRVPRVYGKDRTKGLMKKIKAGVPLTSHKTISFRDIEDFTEEFTQDVLDCGAVRHNNSFINYDCEHRKTIDGIKKMYGWK